MEQPGLVTLGVTTIARITLALGTAVRGTLARADAEGLEARWPTSATAVAESRPLAEARAPKSLKADDSDNSSETVPGEPSPGRFFFFPKNRKFHCPVVR